MIDASAVLSILREPVLVLDKALCPKLANPVFYHTFGLKQDELECEFIREFLSGDNCGAPMGKLLKSIVASNGDVEWVETLCTLQTPSGRPFPLIVTARRLPAKGDIEIILVEFRFNNINKEPERCIYELNEKLRNPESKVDGENKTFDPYTKSICEVCMDNMFQVQEGLESYSDFVAHDLRSPLRFMNKIAHILLTEEKARSEKSSALADSIIKSTDEMGQLIEHLLNFSESSRGPMKIGPVDMHKLFQKIVKQQKDGEEGRDIEIEIQQMKPCRGDPTLLKEVVTNLLENAFKFTRHNEGTKERRNEGTKITIGSTEKDGEYIYFVKDNGVGFDMNKADSLFQLFKRLHDKEVFQGTGIGLALVKRIIERHGGRIWAEGELGKGATFYFTVGKAKAE